MTLTQLAEKHNIDPVAFRLALQEWIDEQENQGYLSVIPQQNGTYMHEYTTLKKNLGVSWQIPLIARPSLLEE